MAVHFHESEVEAEPLDAGLTRQRLITPERVPGTRVLLDRITIAPGAALDLEIASGQPRLVPARRRAKRG